MNLFILICIIFYTKILVFSILLLENSIEYLENSRIQKNALAKKRFLNKKNLLANSRQKKIEADFHFLELTSYFQKCF